MRTIRTIILLLAATLIMAACGADAAMKNGDKYYALGEY